MAQRVQGGIVGWCSYRGFVRGDWVVSMTIWQAMDGSIVLTLRNGSTLKVSGQDAAGKAFCVQEMEQIGSDMLVMLESRADANSIIASGRGRRPLRMAVP